MKIKNIFSVLSVRPSYVLLTPDISMQCYTYLIWNKIHKYLNIVLKKDTAFKRITLSHLLLFISIVEFFSNLYYFIGAHTASDQLELSTFYIEHSILDLEGERESLPFANYNTTTRRFTLESVKVVYRIADIS